MKRMRGLTLIELLSALFALALMAVMGWRGIDGMARSVNAVVASTDRLDALQIGLAQWIADLDAMQQIPQAPVMEWNGTLLRITRRGTTPAEGLRVVAWMQRAGQWVRWESAPVVSRRELALAWEDAGMWSLGLPAGSGREIVIATRASWQLYYFRGGAWTHPLSDGQDLQPWPGSSGDVRNPQMTTQRQAVPDGVRLVLEFPPGQGPAGPIVLDWASPKVLARRS